MFYIRKREERNNVIDHDHGDCFIIYVHRSQL